LKSLKKYNETDKRLDKFLKANLVDQEAIKKKISIKIAKGEIESAIEDINSYLKMNPMDQEAWLELHDIYMRNQE
jgi:DNA-binding SARP family transcriptional activator